MKCGPVQKSTWMAKGHTGQIKRVAQQRHMYDSKAIPKKQDPADLAPATTSTVRRISNCLKGALDLDSDKMRRPIIIELGTPESEVLNLS